MQACSRWCRAWRRRLVDCMSKTGHTCGRLHAQVAGGQGAARAAIGANLGQGGRVAHACSSGPCSAAGSGAQSSLLCKLVHVGVVGCAACMQSRPWRARCKTPMWSLAAGRCSARHAHSRLLQDRKQASHQGLGVLVYLAAGAAGHSVGALVPSGARSPCPDGARRQRRALPASQTALVGWVTGLQAVPVHCIHPARRRWLQPPCVWACACRVCTHGRGTCLCSCSRQRWPRPGVLANRGAAAVGAT